MSSFNNMIEYLLEDETGIPNPEGSDPGKGTGRDFVNSVIANIPELGNLQKDMTEKLLNNPSRRMLTLLDRRIDRITDIQELISGINEEMKLFSSPDEAVRISKKIAGPKFGQERGVFDQSPLEQAIYTTAADWNNGTLLKKIGMVGKAIGGIVNPTASVSTGVFS